MTNDRISGTDRTDDDTTGAPIDRTTELWN